jgi:hypothetical protein
LSILNNRVQVLKTNDFQCAVRIQTLHISRNPLRDIQNNVLAPVSESDGTLLYDRASVWSQGQKWNMLSGSNVWCLNLKWASAKLRHLRLEAPLRRLTKLVLLSVGCYELPGDLFHHLVSLNSLELGNNNIYSLSLNNPFKYMKGLELYCWIIILVLFNYLINQIRSQLHIHGLLAKLIVFNSLTILSGKVFVWKVFSLFPLNPRNSKPFIYLKGLFKDSEYMLLLPSSNEFKLIEDNQFSKQPVYM